MISPIPVIFPRSGDAIFTAFGHIECLVNNAGPSAKSPGDLFDFSAESYDRNFWPMWLSRVLTRRLWRDLLHQPLVQAWEVGRAVATMAAGELPFTTGTAIQVDDGMHIHQY
jgi:hypothetical protein